ncbi:MAG: hypothetical protein GC161_07710 [Planctomycetaceae bacterium]|nr:hypothetical protein [Planctomycetaceae bacterium]
MFTTAIRALMLLALAAGSVTAGTARVSNDDAAQRVAVEVLADLDQLIDTHRAFLESAPNRVATIWIGKAHTAAKAMVDSGPDEELLAEFHNHLDEFMRAMSGDADSHRVTAPSGTVAKAVLKAAKAVEKKCNATPGMQALALVKLTRDTSAADAVRYGLLSVDKIEFVLIHRGMKVITGDARKQTDAIMGPAYAALRDALDSLIGADGERRIQVGDVGTALPDQLAPTMKAIANARQNLDRLRLSVPWADRRVELARADLDRLEKNIGKPAVMREGPPKE